MRAWVGRSPDRFGVGLYLVEDSNRDSIRPAFVDAEGEVLFNYNVSIKKGDRIKPLFNMDESIFRAIVNAVFESEESVRVQTELTRLRAMVAQLEVHLYDMRLVAFQSLGITLSRPLSPRIIDELHEVPSLGNVNAIDQSAFGRRYGRSFEPPQAEANPEGEASPLTNLRNRRDREV